MRKFLFFKVLVVFLTLSGFSWNAFAQDDAFKKGDNVINVGVGLGTYFSDKGFSMSVPPISGSFEYGVVDLFDGKGAIGVGGYLSYLLRKSNGDDSFNVGDFVIGPRGLFHYQFVDKLDTYAGLMLGYDVVSFNNKNASLSGSGFYSAFFIGGRYYFTNAIAVFGELGYGISPLQLGISFKF